MATATVYKRVNMDAFEFWDWETVPVHTPTHIVERAGSRLQDYTGVNFTFSDTGVTGGTLHGTFYKVGGELQYKVTGLSHSAKKVSDYLDNYDSTVLSYLFNGNDTFNGSSFNDVLNGYNGNDTMIGGAGNDKLDGGKGTDVLRGLAGADVLIGGLGADKFDFDLASHSGPLSSTRDRITDFKASQSDKIDLKGIDAKAGGGDNAFKFIGEKAFSNSDASGQLRFDSSTHILYGSTDADNAAEFSILLTGVNSMTGGNFIL